MLEKALPAKSSIPSSPPSLAHNNLLPNAQALVAYGAVGSSADLTPKTSQERWNQAELGYFDPHLDKAHGEGEIVSVGKDVYYKNVVLFVQCLQSFVTFRGPALVKANIATSLRGSALEWYASELSDFDHDALNNNPGVKSWINTISHRFKVPTNVALGLLTDETYSLDDARARGPSAQYVRAIMRYGIGCNIVNVANQLSFAYQGLASSQNRTQQALSPDRPYESTQRVFPQFISAVSDPNPPKRASLPSQSKAFYHYRVQQASVIRQGQ